MTPIKLSSSSRALKHTLAYLQEIQMHTIKTNHEAQVTPLIEKIAIHIDAVWLREIIRNQLSNRRQERRFLLRAIRYISQVGTLFLGWWYWFCSGRRINAAHQGFRMLHSGYSLELLVANIGPSATLSRLGGLRVLLRAETRQKIRVRLKLGTWDEQQQACESTKRRSQACPDRGAAPACWSPGLCCAVTLAVVPL